jgi:hypothetical protein
MIFKLARNYVGYFVTAIAAVAAAGWIESDFIKESILPNLTTIVLALLAINVQTTAVIAVKLREIADREKKDFRSTIWQFRIAVIEQAVFVILSLILAAISKSSLLVPLSGLLDVASLFVFFASLHVFIDTTNALFLSMFPKS